MCPDVLVQEAGYPLGMGLALSLPFIVAGLVLLGLAFAVPLSADFFLLRLLVAWVGLFAVCFGPAALIPLVLLATYAFTIYFPILVDNYLSVGFISTAVAPVAWLARLSGLHIVSGSQTFQFSLPSGQPIVVQVASACAGPATMAVFVVIFALMMLDLPLPWSRAVQVFLFGMVGTWLQNVIRIIIILGCGYFWGYKALEAAHYWTVYIMFPLWYLLFASVYFRCVKRRLPPCPAERPGISLLVPALIIPFGELTGRHVLGTMRNGIKKPVTLFK